MAWFRTRCAAWAVMIPACGSATGGGEEDFARRTVKLGCAFDRKCDPDAFDYASDAACTRDRFRGGQWCDGDFLRDGVADCLDALRENAQTCGEFYEHVQEPCWDTCSQGIVGVDQYGPGVYYDGN